jgi:hypothetical protein
LEPEESPDECPGKEEPQTEEPSLKELLDPDDALTPDSESRLPPELPDEPEEESHAVHVVVTVTFGAAVASAAVVAGAAVVATAVVTGTAVVAPADVAGAAVVATVVAPAVVAGAAVVAPAVVAGAAVDVAPAVVAPAVVVVPLIDGTDKRRIVRVKGNAIVLELISGLQGWQCKGLA